MTAKRANVGLVSARVLRSYERVEATLVLLACGADRGAIGSLIMLRNGCRRAAAMTIGHAHDSIVMEVERTCMQSYPDRAEVQPLQFMSGRERMRR